MQDFDTWSSDIRDQLQGLLERVEIDLQSNPLDTESICKAITAGYFLNTSRLGKSQNADAVLNIMSKVRLFVSTCSRTI